MQNIWISLLVEVLLYILQYRGSEGRMTSKPNKTMYKTIQKNEPVIEPFIKFSPMSH